MRRAREKVASSRKSQILVKTKRQQKLVENSLVINSGKMVAEGKADKFGFISKRESKVKKHTFTCR